MRHYQDINDFVLKEILKLKPEWVNFVIEAGERAFSLGVGKSDLFLGVPFSNIDTRLFNRFIQHLLDPSYHEAYESYNEVIKIQDEHQASAHSLINKVNTDATIMLKKFPMLSHKHSDENDEQRDNFYFTIQINEAILTSSELSIQGSYVNSRKKHKEMLAFINDSTLRNSFLGEVASLVEKYRVEVTTLRGDEIRLRFALDKFKGRIQGIIDEIVISETLAGECIIEDMVNGTHIYQRNSEL